MKTRNTIGWNVVVALALLLAAGASQAQTVIFDTVTMPPDPNKAIGIDGLVVDGVTYNVDFTARTNPQGAYGDFPGVLTFNDEASATLAHDAVDLALNGAPAATTVGAPYNAGQAAYIVGYRSDDTPPNGALVHLLSEYDGGPWALFPSPREEILPWNGLFPTTKAIALFTVAGASPAPTIDFSADPETIVLGQSSTLSWSVMTATTCTGSLGSSDWPGNKNLPSGSDAVFPTASSTYRLTCDGPGGTSESDVSVAVFDVMLGTTELRQTKKVNLTANIGVLGNYEKPGFPLLLPQSSISMNTLSHDGGGFTFGSSETPTTYSYDNWTFEIRSTCAADGDACLVETNSGFDTPWALRDVDAANGTARMAFTDEGADAFNDLAVVPSIVQVFVTSERFTGDLRLAGETNGLDGGDNICTNAAMNASPPLAGAWTAWLSDGTVDAGDRMFDAQFQRLDGVVIANSLADLTDDSLDAPIIVTENGDELIPDGSLEDVWTATLGDGIWVSIGGSCQSWTSSSRQSAARIGLATQVDLQWTTVGASNSCDLPARLYCFSASKFLPEETFADVTFIPEPSGAALGMAALSTLGLIRARRRRR